jgi:hypothetical protein
MIDNSHSTGATDAAIAADQHREGTATSVIGESGARGYLGPKTSAYEERTPGGSIAGFTFGRVPTGRWHVFRDGGRWYRLVDSEAVAIALVKERS